MAACINKRFNKCLITFCRLLKLYPKGYSAYSAPDDKWVSIFLFPDVGEILKEDDKIYVQANLKVEDPRGSNHLTRNSML